MIYETIALHPFEDATLTAICVSNTEELKQTPRRAVIICPGGGYHALSDREAEPIAAQFLAAGFATFILRYTVKNTPEGYGARDCRPLKQIALAIRYVRENAERYNVDPDYVFTCGFSAGAHLAGSAGVFWNDPVVHEVLGLEDTSVARPTGMILAYAVVTSGVFAHRGSFYHLCGSKEATQEQMDRFSLELHVDSTTPPAFLWHTATDAAVPVQNSLLMASALAAVKVPFELHIFPEGPHGLALCNEQTQSGHASMIQPHAECWMELAIKWAKELKA